MRKCGDCQECCRLLPVAEILKPSLQKCPHQKFGKGCVIYKKRPASCSVWSCLWLNVPKYTKDLRRPDRSHYVVDILTDEIMSVNLFSETREQVVQVWTDPKYPNAYKDPNLREMLIKHFNGKALIRFGSNNAIFIYHENGVWYETRSKLR